MKNHRPLAVLAWCVLFFFAGFAVYANGQKESSTSMAATTGAKKTITVWLAYLNAAQIKSYNQTIIDTFNHSQSKYTAKATLIQNESQQLRLALSAGKGPDIVGTAGPSVLVTFAKNGLVIPLDNYAKQYSWNKLFIPSMLALQDYKGKLYGLPDEYESMFLYYNKTLFEKNGWKPPKTLADLEHVAAAAKSMGITPFSGGNSDWKGTNEWYVTVFLNHYAGAHNLYEALTGKLAWNSPVFVNAIKLLNDWWQKGWFDSNYYSLTGDQAVNDLSTGKSAMEFTGSWGVGRMINFFGKSGQQWDWTPVPALSSNAAYPLFELGIGGTASINKYSKSPNGAAEFLNFIYQPKHFLAWTAAQPGTGMLFPPEKVTTNDLQAVASKLNPQFMHQTTTVSRAIASGNYGYTTWTFWPDRTEQYIINGIEKVWAKEITPQQYMDKVNTEFQADLKAGRVPPITKPGAGGY